MNQATTGTINEVSRHTFLQILFEVKHPSEKHNTERDTGTNTHGFEL